MTFNGTTYSSIPFSKQLDKGAIRFMVWQDQVSVNPAVRGGKPCIRGTRITVYNGLEPATRSTTLSHWQGRRLVENSCSFSTWARRRLMRLL